MRTFVALDIPDPARTKLMKGLEELKTRLHGVRFIRGENLHVTLRFFGATPEERIAPLVAGLEALCGQTPSMVVHIGGIGFFPSASWPRVVFVGLSLPPPAYLLQRSCETLAVSLGFDAEPRAFRPHLTLGRVESRQRLTGEDIPALDIGNVLLDRVVFFRSDLRPGGAVHTPIEAWTLPAG